MPALAPTTIALALSVVLPLVAQEHPAASGGHYSVVATVPPLADLARRLAGGDAEVTALIPPGVDDETYEPTARDLTELERAALILRVGHPAIGIEARVLEPFRQSHPRARILSLASVIEVSTATDPHLWMSPRSMRAFAESVRDALDAIDPERREAHAARLAALSRDIAEVDARLVDAGAASAAFIVVHPAFGALARYGLKEEAIERDGKEPGMASLVALVDRGRTEHVRLVVTQPGFPRRAAEVVAGELGARVLSIDPLAADWLGSLRRLADALGDLRVAAAAATPPSGGGR
ncbi:MAG: zinc ABC transporter substrate-binding protein [Acidobacteriota bacterium]